ncbi:MAG: hexosaminidase, partial [Actinomycetota bacterium]|nr:hexosaminidase [Actinomycetota bacterium]
MQRCGVLLGVAALTMACTPQASKHGTSNPSVPPQDSAPIVSPTSPASASTSPSAAITSPGSALTSTGPDGAIVAGLIPLPVSATSDDSNSFTFTATTQIVTGQNPDVAEVGTDLAAVLRPSTGFGFPVLQSTDVVPNNSVVLQLGPTDATLGTEGYELTISKSGVLLTANDATGLFRGVQTMRQLLPASVDSASVQPGPWRIAGGHIVDYPRYAYRGAMLDVTRHFFPVRTVERYIDELALYKVNVLHLHLSDDQGWRIAIDA